VASARNFIVVLAAYWGFTLTDGALRMLVLLHFYSLGYTPFQLAFLFVLYEAFGAVTNLVGGWIGSRIGLKVTLWSGLALQIVSLLMLSFLDPGWSKAASVVYVVCAQGLAGIAKDLTKSSSKSTIKVFVPTGGHSTLFRWVSILTGSKNALKGAGFFLGGALLAGLGFAAALWTMAAALALVLVGAVTLLPSGLGRSKAKAKFSAILSKSAEINLLSGARFFLFGARDVWFVVGIPIFLYSLGWRYIQVAGFLAAWTIGYGFVQAVAPSLVKRSTDGRSAETRAARLWALVLAAVPLAIIAAMSKGVDPGLTIVVGLALFGFVFAVNSSIHSYLLLAYTDADKVALNVGFYYMANSGGRLLGTLLSGLVYQWGGVTGCLGTASALVLCSWLITLALPTRGFEGLAAPLGALPDSE
jgi:predicted MFS family arabinose efflux permease